MCVATVSRRVGVRQVGVDINLAVDRPHIHGHTLQFVSGLGPRKASELLQVGREGIDGGRAS
jgi:transcriptional accessory protein Tex/SPT6